MGKKADGQNTYPVALDYFVFKCRQIESAGLDMSLKSENPTNNGVWFRFHHGFSMRSYGEKITVTLTPDNAGTLVQIHSECGMPTQLVDYGMNKKNVASLFQYFEDGMQFAGSPAPQNFQAPPSAPIPPAPQNFQAPPDAPAPQSFQTPPDAPAPQSFQTPPDAPAPQSFQAPPAPGIGTPPAFVFCTNCGKKHPGGTRFCNSCGTKLKSL